MGDVLVCSIGSGPHRELLEIARPKLEEWAARQGYDLDLRTVAESDGRPPAWAKIRLLRESLNTHRTVLWTDADAVVVDTGHNLAATVTRRRPIAMVEHHYDGNTIPNMGVIALRAGRASRRFLERIWEMSQYIDHPWWENAAALDLLGFDFDAPPIQQVRRPLLARRITWLGNEWNSIDQDPAEDPVIVHYPGMSNDARRERMTAAAARSWTP